MLTFNNHLTTIMTALYKLWYRAVCFRKKPCSVFLCKYILQQQNIFYCEQAIAV